MSADYVKYLVDNKERIHKEFKMYVEFWSREEIRIREEFPELSNTERFSKLAEEWKAYKATLEVAVDAEEEPEDEPADAEEAEEAEDEPAEADEAEEAVVEVKEEEKPTKPKKAKKEAKTDKKKKDKDSE
jgi:outer membrane biosynthesis protein TonB